MAKRTHSWRGDFLVSSITLNNKLFAFTVILTVAVITLSIFPGVGVMSVVRSAFDIILPEYNGKVTPTVNAASDTQEIINIYILDRGNGHPNNNHIKQVFEAVACITKHDNGLKTSITRGDFYSFEPFKYDIIILQDYRPSSGEGELLLANDPETSAISSFIKSGKTAIAIGCPFYDNNISLRDVFGVYFDQALVEDCNYMVTLNHPLTEEFEECFAIPPKDVNPYGWPIMVKDEQSNSSVYVLIESEQSEPAMTIANYGEGKAIAFCFASWTPIPSINTPISEYKKCNKPICVLANTIEWIAETQKNE
ncbi:MAG TPA: hypothetical protein ENN38_04360 [Actinobacteria bacterium]|nr:hypothetical protein [Actinomycetota bacterium]